MICPHCNKGIHSDWHRIKICDHRDDHWLVAYQVCPECKELMIRLETWRSPLLGGDRELEAERLVYPKTSNRPPVPVEVPKEFGRYYSQAALVLADSPEASAALSRKCLQHILREKAKVKRANLATEIQEVLDSKSLPSYLAESIDIVRNVGNFSAHPIKSESTDEIVDVEAGEAETNLDVLEGLFDFYFVMPARVKGKREKINDKLKDAGIPPLKGSPAE